MKVPTLNLFFQVVESVKVRMRKPEERIYQHTLDLLNVAPHETVFLDDLGGNVKAARDLGIKTIKVKNNDSNNYHNHKNRHHRD